MEATYKPPMPIPPPLPALPPPPETSFSAAVPADKPAAEQNSKPDRTDVLFWIGMAVIIVMCVYPDAGTLASTAIAPLAWAWRSFAELDSNDRFPVIWVICASITGVASASVMVYDRWRVHCGHDPLISTGPNNTVGDYTAFTIASLIAAMCSFILLPIAIIYALAFAADRAIRAAASSFVANRA